MLFRSLTDDRFKTGLFRRNALTAVGSTSATSKLYDIERQMMKLLSDYGKADIDFFGRMAQFHLGFETLYPFGNGNGRTGRLVLNLELLKGGYRPVDIKCTDKQRYCEAFDNGTVDRVIGWKAGEFCYDVSPAIFTKENLDELVYNSFCGANQSKFLVGAATMDVPFRAPNAPEPPQPKKILALLKPCDCYSYNQLQTEHRLDAEKVYALGIPCTGMIDVNKIKAKGKIGRAHV